MLDEKILERKERRRLSIITDILILLTIILTMILLVQKLGISNRYESNEVVSLIDSDTNSLVFEENESYIKNIKEKYGIIIQYADEVSPFANRVEATAQTDINIVNNNLKAIEKSLEKYPKEVFNMSLSKSNPIYIMLIDKFSNDNIALASRNNLDQYRIYISNTQNFERALHHEMYHVLEYYMYKKNSNIYANWMRLNPEDFRYSEDVAKLTKDYVYIKENDSILEDIGTDVYFVTKYSKTTEKEDRAEIFTELMMSNSAPKYLGKNSKIKPKAIEIFNTIKKTITRQEFNCNKYL